MSKSSFLLVYSFSNSRKRFVYEFVDSLIRTRVEAEIVFEEWKVNANDIDWKMDNIFRHSFRQGFGRITEAIMNLNSEIIICLMLCSLWGVIHCQQG